MRFGAACGSKQGAVRVSVRFGAGDLGEWIPKGGDPVIHSDAPSVLALCGLLVLVIVLCSRN